MNIKFYKYQGAGNDFVFLNNFSGEYNDITLDQIRKVCDRRFGIGGDGFIKIDASEEWDFIMDYYNSDGSKSFCGNGARCAVRFVNEQLLKKDKYQFKAIDGVHSAQLIGDLVSLEMLPVNEVEVVDADTFVLDTGSPHFIHFTEGLSDFDIYAFGRKIRYGSLYKEFGINVNAVEIHSANSLSIRTYERGVENETLACGTGITAAAIAYAVKMDLEGEVDVNLKAKGGDLSVKMYRSKNNTIREIHLVGPAEYVFEGKINV